VNAHTLGILIAESLATDASTGDRLRLVRQFIMDVDRLEPTEVSAQVAQAPQFSGDRGWDALIAGVVEDVVFRHGVPVPPWAMEPTRSTDDRWWFVTSIPALHPTAFVETPASLANRGVFIRRASLVNI
jgi:hypothetical protein